MPWAQDRVARVDARLQSRRRRAERFKTEILWLSIATAFTAPGKYIYVSRRLLERFASDEPLAFVIAHEIAHHDLGHTELFRGWLARLPRGVASEVVATTVRMAEKFAYNPVREAAADRHAIELCAAAGYDLDRCLKVFDVLESEVLDHGDLEMVFGPELPIDEGGHEWVRQLKVWTQQRERGYPTIRERKAAVAVRARELVPASRRRG